MDSYKIPLGESRLILTLGRELKIKVITESMILRGQGNVCVQV